MPVIGALLLAAGLVLWWRSRYLSNILQTDLRRRPIGADGVIAGAEGFVYARPGAPAVLLLHGAGDTPQTLRYLATALYEAGFHVSAPLLPGHGRSIAEFGRVRANDWLDVAAENYRELQRAHPWLGLIGLSMGGALAVQIAAEHPDLPALGLAAPYLAMPRGIERAARLAWLWGPILPVLRSANGLSVLDPVERDRSLAYGVFTPNALRALRVTVRRAIDALPRVAAPTLMIQSREDNRISVSDAERAFDRLGSREKRLQWITGAAHVITVDHGHEIVISSLVSWMRARAFSR